MTALNINKTPEVFYFGKKYQYYRQIGGGSWIGFNQGDARLHLKSQGLDNESRDVHGLTEIDRYILKIQKERCVNDVISLAGYHTGLQRLGDLTALVVDSPTFIQPVQGDWSLIDRLCADVLGEEQKQHFFSWLQVGMRNLREANYSARGQAVFFVGPARSCKSLLQDLITKLLGNRMAKPNQYLMGQTTFNAELFRAEHLIIEDESGLEFDERGAFSIRFKGLIANMSHLRHEKGHTPNSYSPKWRITISLNNDVESLKIIPLMDSGMRDKINIYKCRIPDLSDVIPMEVIRNDRALMDIFYKQLPAFVNFLLNEYQIPENLKTPRFGVREFHNKEILETVTMSPSMRAFNDLLEDSLCLGKAPRMGFVGKAGDFVAFFKLTGMALEKSYGSPVTFGRRANELCESRELASRIAIKNHTARSSTFVIANDVTLPMLEEHSIKDIADSIRDDALKQNAYVSPLVLRQAFEKWITTNQGN